MPGGAAFGQATFDTANVPQPHLEAARRIAAGENSWRHPGLSTCYPDDEAVATNSATGPAAPKMFDNLYFVGNTRYAVYALDTSAGIVLFDALGNQEEAEKFIIPGLIKAGLDPARLKALIVSHGIGDHFGGGGYLQEKYGLKVYMSAADWDLAANPPGGGNARQAALPPEQQRRAPRRDQVIKDGDSVSFGDETLKVFVAPNALTLLIPVKDHGKPHLLAWFGGAIDNSVERQTAIIRGNKVEGYLGNHAIYNDALFKLEALRAFPANPNPFLIGTEDTVRFVEEVRECQLNFADIRKAIPGWRSRR